MALITITGTIVDSKITLPDEGGVIEFWLNDYFIRSDGKAIAPKMQSAELDKTDGSFTVDLESTRDGLPSNRYYTVILRASFGSVPVHRELGRIQAASTPEDQDFDALLADTLTLEGTGRHVERETPSGTINGVNRIFTLTYMPLLDSEMVFIGSVYQVPTVSYTINGGIITFADGSQPIEGDTLSIWYRRR